MNKFLEKNEYFNNLCKTKVKIKLEKREKWNRQNKNKMKNVPPPVQSPDYFM